MEFQGLQEGKNITHELVLRFPKLLSQEYSFKIWVTTERLGTLGRNVKRVLLIRVTEVLRARFSANPQANPAR